MSIYNYYINVFKEQIEFLDGIEEETKDLINLYTDSDHYKQINRKLCRNVNLSVKEDKIVSRLKSIFEVITPLKEAITVYRGIKSYSVNLNRLSCQFISTSLDINVPKHFMGDECCLMIITIPAGARVIPLMNISTIPDEYEVLIPENGTWTITSKDTYLYIPSNTYILNIDSIKYKENENKENEINRVLFLFSQDESDLYQNLDEYLLSLISFLKVNVSLNDVKNKLNNM